MVHYTQPNWAVYSPIVPRMFSVGTVARWSTYDTWGGRIPLELWTLCDGVFGFLERLPRKMFQACFCWLHEAHLHLHPTKSWCRAQLLCTSAHCLAEPTCPVAQVSFRRESGLSSKPIVCHDSLSKTSLISYIYYCCLIFLLSFVPASYI